MSSANWLLIIVVIIAVALVGGWFLSMQNVQPIPETPTTTSEIPTGPQATYTNTDSNTIQIMKPLPGETASSTFVVSGQARGSWYFEASFPLNLVSATGTILTQMPVQA